MKLTADCQTFSFDLTTLCLCNTLDHSLYLQGTYITKFQENQTIKCSFLSIKICLVGFCFLKQARDRAPLTSDWRATLKFLKTMFSCCQNKKKIINILMVVAGR